MSRNLLRITWTSSPDPTLQRLWRIYLDIMTWTESPNETVRKFALRDADWALENYFRAVEDELEWLNAE